MDLSKAKATTSLPVSDLASAVAWYRERLGAEPTQINEEEAEFMCGDGTSFFLYPSQFAGTNQGTAMSLRVDDVEGAVADLRGRGVAFEHYDFEDFKTVDGIASVPDGRKVAWFKDPDGNIIAIGSG